MSVGNWLCSRFNNKIQERNRHPRNPNAFRAQRLGLLFPMREEQELGAVRHSKRNCYYTVEINK